MSADPAQVHHIRAIISRMKPPIREVFLMSCVADRRNDEIAEYLGIDIAEVEERLAEAILHLARGLKEEWNG